MSRASSSVAMSRGLAMRWCEFCQLQEALTGGGKVRLVTFVQPGALALSKPRSYKDASDALPRLPTSPGVTGVSEGPLGSQG